MALINCPECGKEISDEAKTCPNCGKPLKKPKEKKKVNKKAVIICAVIMSIMVIGGSIGFSFYSNTPDYVMKQYVKANNNKNQRLLKKLIYLENENEYEVMDINEAYEEGYTDKITDYGYYNKPKENTALFYTEYKDGENRGGIGIKKINNKWKVMRCPIMTSK